MKLHPVRTYRSDENLAKEDQLAWKVAQVAVDPVAVEHEVTEMVINRVIDNAAVAVASIGRAPAVAARGQAEAHPASPGSTVFGIDGRFSPSIDDVLALAPPVLRHRMAVSFAGRAEGVTVARVIEQISAPLR